MAVLLKAVLPYLIALAAGWRLMLALRRAKTGSIPAPRAILPGLVFLAAACAATRLVPKAVIVAAIVLLELYVEATAIVIAIRASRSRTGNLEERLADAFAPFYPPALGRYLAFELAVIWNAAHGIRTTFAPSKSSAVSYVEKNMLGMFGLVLLVGAIPEMLLHHVLLPARDWWIALILDVLVLYASAWVLGLYGLMARRPHEIGERVAVFHRGPLGRAEIAREAVVDVQAVRNPDSRAIRKACRAGYLGLPGTDLVRVTLREPARVVRTFPVVREAASSEIFVPSDRPHELCAQLRN